MSRDIVASLKFKKERNDSGFTTAKLEAALEQGYMKQARPNKWTKKQTFAPSSIGYGHGTCARYWYQAFNGAFFHEKVDAMGVANMSNGTYVHDRLAKLFEDAGIMVESEIEMKLADPPVRGYIDAIVEIDGEKVVGEFKSARSEAFEWRRATMKPSGNHLYQILLYMEYTGLRGFMFYENKNDNTFLTIPVEMNDRNKKILEEALDWLRLVRSNWEKGEGTNSHIPQRMPTKKNKNCRGCPLWELCWADDAPTSDVVIPPMVVATP